MSRTIVIGLCVMAAMGCKSSSDSDSTPPGPDDGVVDQGAPDQANNNDQGSSDDAAAEADVNSPDADPQGCGPAAVVEFQTSDDVKLVADLQPAASPNRGAVVLLHMIPPNWDRSSYPQRVRDAILALDLNVLNVDRRGAGDSEGVARQAYEGDTARLDAEAAVRFLLHADRACAVDPAAIALVGASNGTTTVLDYTVNRSDDLLPQPAALVWLSPGTYTEEQNPIADHRGVLDPLPLLIVHPTNEPWAEQFQDDKPAAWQIVTIENGQHGTQNFDDGSLEAIQLPALIDHLRSTIAAN